LLVSPLVIEPAQINLAYVPQSVHKFTDECKPFMLISVLMWVQ